MIRHYCTICGASWQIPGAHTHDADTPELYPFPDFNIEFVQHSGDIPPDGKLHPDDWPPHNKEILNAKRYLHLRGDYMHGSYLAVTFNRLIPSGLVRLRDLSLDSEVDAAMGRKEAFRGKI